MKKKTLSMALALLMIIGVFTAMFAGTVSAAEKTPLAESVNSVLVKKTAAAYKPGRVILAKRTSMVGTKVTLKWKKVSGATGYKIYRAAKKKGKYRKIKVLRGASKVKFTDTGRTASKTYYYKVRAFRRANGKTYHGPYSVIRAASQSLTARFAYAAFLKKWRNNYSYPSDDPTGGEPRFQLAYIGADNIPELLTVTGTYHVAGVNVYTYYNGKVKELAIPNNAFDSGPGGGFGQFGSFEYVPKKNIIRDNYSFLGQGSCLCQFFKIKNGKAVLLQSFEHDRWESIYQVGGKVVSEGTFNSKQKNFQRKYVSAAYETTAFLANNSNINKMIKNPGKFVKEKNLETYSLT